MVKGKRHNGKLSRRNKKQQDELFILSDSGRWYKSSSGDGRRQNIGCKEGVCHPTYREFCRAPVASTMMIKLGGLAPPFDSGVSFEQLYNKSYANDTAKEVLKKLRHIIKSFAETYLKKSENKPNFRKEVLEKLEDIKRNMEFEYGIGEETTVDMEKGEENFNIIQRLFDECAKIIQNHSILGGQVGLSIRRIGDEFAFVMHQMFPRLAMEKAVSYDDFYMGTSQPYLLTPTDIVSFSRKIGLTRLLPTHSPGEYSPEAPK